MNRVDEICDDLELIIAEHKAFRRVVDENTKLKSVIEDIKADIQKVIDEDVQNCDFTDLDEALKIIDKHIADIKGGKTG